MERLRRIVGTALSAALVAAGLTAASMAGAPPATAAATAIEGGTYHSCAITPKGALYCWGYNLYGQLGFGTSGAGAHLPMPVRVKNMNRGVVAVSAGYGHTCAIKGKKRTLFCWGENNLGQLGRGAVGPAPYVFPSPVKVKKMNKDVVAVQASDHHTCAIQGKKRTLFCWGANGEGQLGLGTSIFGDHRPAPVKVRNMNRGVVSVVGGYAHTCAIQGKKRTLFCWGENDKGQLGIGSVSDSHNLPVKVKRMGLGVRTIDAGEYHTCAIQGKKRTLYCWGENFHGQLGRGAFGPAPYIFPSPVRVKKMKKRVDYVSAGEDHTCAIQGKKRTLSCWGNDAYGQLGQGPTGIVFRHTPLKVKNMKKGVVSVSGGGYHTCAIKGKKVPYCWGRNEDGQLGTGSGQTFHLVPAKVKL